MIQELKLKEFNKRLKRLPLAKKQKLITKESFEELDDLHVVYVMSHVGVSGGVKIIFEHVNRLKKLGVQVSIVSHFENPAWYPIEANYIQVPFDMELAKGIPDCQVIVATYWDHIQSCIDTGIAPVVYFEQGDFHIFEYEMMNEVLKKFIDKQFQLPEFIYTVSHSTAKYIEGHYHRKAKVINNAIDETIFSEHIEAYQHSNPYLLMVGAESAKFKGISDIIQAYELLKEKGIDIDLIWITPEDPSVQMKDRVTKYFIQPNQQTIANLYKGATVYISASHYESFSLPPLEAMACGCPVVTTNNKGVLEYALHEENALLCEKKNVKDMAAKVEQLLQDKLLKEKLVQNGLLTVRKFNWSQITGELLEYYREVSGLEVCPTFQLDEWEITLTEDMCLQKGDYAKLLKFLQCSKANFIQVPVVYSIDGFIQFARWEVVARRKKLSMSIDLDQCYCPILPFNHLSILNEKAYRSFYKREFEESYAEFTDLYNKQQEPKLQAVYFRWMILCLYRLQRKYEARSKISKWIEHYKHPYFSDFDFLEILLGGKENSTFFRKICLLGDATSYPEFIFNIKDHVINNRITKE
ncbi:glycosyltransferase family 4 protein [Anaerobacillus sp. CMMVII]|uniref:glycosyltransferase family 4 protein n=1 Tax=Anaerobacillus sp. CMMVII TaxID=2755588 RepID=UPI0021B8362C|nr:glycosyltransferase family 4 protein [Anaerobacillus sp. CMMVII]MCT8140004.1 glycosyltransferase family 4 protein [Anaerobacillus sp. CMMVII]